MSIENEIPFPADVLGQADNVGHPVAQFQREVMAVEGAPAEFVVPTLLSACSVAGARGLEVESFNGKFSRPNTYILVEGQSGTGKSSVGMKAFAPIFECDHKARRHFDEHDKPKLIAKVRILEAKLRKAEKAEILSEAGITELMLEKLDLERKMCGPRFVVDDCTQEALEQVLSQQGGVAAQISTDARKAVKNILGRHRNGAMEEDVYIKGWSGDPFSVDRITRRGIPPVTDPCLAMYLALQPDLFRQIFRRELVESGFVSRLLPVSECDGFTVHASAKSYDPEIQKRYTEHLGKAFTFYRTLERPFRFAMSPEARVVMDQFFYEAANLVVVDPALAPLYRRWAEQACRIAVCIQIACLGWTAHMQPLHVYFARKAVELMRWFGQQQRELLLDHSEASTSELARGLLDLVQQHLGGISLRQAWKKLGSSSAAVRAIVAADSRLELIAVPTTGRPTEVIRMKNATPGL